MNFEKLQADYRNAGPSLLGRGMERLTNPFGKALAGVVPNALMEAVVKGIDSAASLPNLGRFTHDTSDLDASYTAAQAIERRAKNWNGASGALAGLGGAISAGLDVPASIGLALRAIRDTGRAYGYDGEGEAEKLFRLQILELAALADPAERRKRITGLENAIAADGSLVPVSGDASTPMVEAAVERISRAIAINTVRRRVGMVIPFAGSIIGLTVNRSFQGDVARAARFAFQARRLKAAAKA